MQYNKKWLGNAARCVFTLCLSLALCINMEIPGPLDSQVIGQAGQAFRSDIIEPIWNITGLATKGSLVTPLFFLLLWVNWKIDAQKTERRFVFLLVSGLIALVWLMAEGFRVDDTLWTLYASYAQILKSTIYFVGVTYGLNQISYFLYGALEYKGKKRSGSPLTSQRTWHSLIVKAYREHTVLVSFGAIFILWLPHLLLSNPPYITPDAQDQLEQFFGLRSYSSHHPVTSTLIMGGLVKAGSLISDDFGLFFYVAVQAIIGAWILAYTLHLMRKLNTPIWLRVLTYGCYVFVPYYTNYIGCLLKDVPYSYAVLLFVTELIYILVQGGDVFRSKSHILLLAVSIAGSVLLRNNGKYVLYPTIVAVLLYLFRKRKSGMDSKEHRRILCAAAAVFLIPALLAEVFSAAVMSYLNVEPGSIREALSMPMQQTARYVKEFGDEVTEEERSAISAVLDYENLAEKYNPRISDPVKHTFKYRPTTGELRDYLLVWLKQFTKHPFVYIKATVNQNYYMLYPYIPNNVIVANPIDESQGGTEPIGLLDNGGVDFHVLLYAFYTMCFYFPGLNLLSHPAFYMILLIWLTMFSLCKKRFPWPLASITLWMSAVIVVLSPAIQINPRYAFPVIYAMPITLAYYIYLGRSKESLDK